MQMSNVFFKQTGLNDFLIHQAPIITTINTQRYIRGPGDARAGSGRGTGVGAAGRGGRRRCIPQAVPAEPALELAEPQEVPAGAGDRDYCFA